MRWFFPNSPLHRISFLKRQLTLIGLSILLQVLTGALSEPGSAIAVLLLLVTVVVSVALGIASLILMWWRIRSCFHKETHVWIGFVLSLIPLIGVVWYFWPPKLAEGDAEVSGSNGTIVAVAAALIIGVMVLGLFSGITSSAYKDYLERAEALEAQKGAADLTQ